MLDYILINDSGERYVEVPVHKMTRQYIQSTMNFRGGFVYVRVDDWVGSAFGLVLEKKPYRRRTLRRKSIEPKVKIVLPQNLCYGKVDESAIGKIGANLDNVVKTVFHNFVLGATQTGSSDNFAVLRFLELFGIKEEDYSSDTARRSWRYFKSCQKNVKN